MEARQITKLANQYGASLVLYARQWTRDPDDAVQEAFVDLMKSTDSPVDPAAWLFTTVKRKAMNHARRESRQRKHAQSLAAQRDSWFEPNCQCTTIDAEEVCDQLQRLPDMEREIVVARIWGELSYEQIAGLVGQSRSSVHRRYQSALQRLAAPRRADLKNNNNQQVVP